MEQKYILTNGVTNVTTNVDGLMNGVYFVRITDLSSASIENKTFVKH